MPKSLKDLVREALAEIEEISAEEAKRRLAAAEREGWHFLDVREPDEFAAGRIPGAYNVPRGVLEVKADLEHPKRDTWLEDRSRPLVIYCGGGQRSALAARSLQQMGFERVVSMAGGWSAWSGRGYAVER